MDFLQAIEALDLEIHHDQCPPSMLGTALEDTGDLCPFFADMWDTREPDPLLQGLLAKPGDPQHTSVEDLDPQELDFILEHLGDTIYPQHDEGESDPHMEASVQKILEQLMEESAHLLPVRDEPQCGSDPLPPSPPTLPAEAMVEPPAEPAFSCSPPEEKVSSNVPTVNFSDYMQENLVPVASVGDELVYAFPAEAFALAVPPAETTPINRKRPSVDLQNHEEKPYIKKPPNAFMIFRQEQRPKVVEDLNIRDSAVVNVELGRRWSCMSEGDKQMYFQESDRRRHLHEQQHPHWSSGDNYGKKRRRIRRKCPLSSE